MCACPKWIEYQQLKEIESDTTGLNEQKYAIELVPKKGAQTMDIQQLYEKQSPLTMKVKGNFEENRMRHFSNGELFYARTFKYSEFEIVEF